MVEIEQVLKTAEELLSIPSVTGSEKDIADIVEESLRGMQPRTLVRESNSILVAMHPMDQDKQTLMLVGHTDTVPELDKNPVRREADRLYGLGAADMKAACALILHMIEANRAQSCQYNLVGVLYAREEGPYVENELPQLVVASRLWFDHTDLAVCMEPTDNRIELGCLGTCHARVSFAGKRSHSARPWQGENAIHKAAPLLQRLAAFERVEHVFDGLTFYEVISATTVHSVGARNVIPDNLTLNVNYRFAPGKDEATVREWLADIIGDEATWELVDFCPAGRVCSDNPLLQDLLTAAQDPDVCAKQAWTDVGRFSQLGIDAINWGPGSTSQAHQAGEFVLVGDLERSLTVLERWLFG
ncbi:MAG: succinyl-diaminopimelate desuccinylase [Planctomycetota bacterium]|jgi:succinyl-diaminopimelate desuccinylase